MNIDTEHLHFWMQAIRQSPDHMRTLDAFWSGQIKSKEWLIDNLSDFVHKKSTIEIHCGWVGVLASLIFQSKIPVTYISSIDIDPACEPIATMMNKIEEQDGRFRARTTDMCDTEIRADIVINTSTEHITQEQYLKWLRNIPNNSLIVIQSNNYLIPEHVRPMNTLNEFKKSCNLNILRCQELKCQLYDRYMIIGTK